MNAQILLLAVESSEKAFEVLNSLVEQCKREEPDGQLLVDVNAHDTRCAGNMAVTICYARAFLLGAAFGSQQQEKRERGKLDYENFMELYSKMMRAEEAAVGRNWEELWPRLQHRHHMRNAVLQICRGVAEGKDINLKY